MSGKRLPGEDSGEGMAPALRGLAVLCFLYCFLVGVSFLEAGIGALGAGFQTRLLESVSHPISGICAGLLATVLVQSSSVTTATIVGMVGAGTLPFPMAVPMIMGANIGTTVTSTLAALGSIRRAEEFRKAFAAATMHDFFNLLSVALLLPLELATGVMSRIAIGLTGLLHGAELGYDEPGRSPIRTVVKLPVNAVEGLLPEGTGSALLMMALALALIFVALGLITSNMRRLVAGSVEKAMNRIIGRGGGTIGIFVGIAVTVAVQSSSITTSILVPLVASGVLALRSAYPITLGANIGTTVTALIASLAVARPEGLSIALVHLTFNCLGVLLLYPVPQVRVIPIRLAQALADVAVEKHRVVLAWLLTTFLVLPLMGLFLFQ
jgi:solute carrier family 34 (sodium-dependent phosphate cotransporter)